MIDYEALILERQEEYEEPTDYDCRQCPYLWNCQEDEENGKPHVCYLN